MKKRRKAGYKRSYQIMQKHHLEYDPEITVMLTRTEHFFCGRMDQYGKARGFTPGFCAALEHMAHKYVKIETPFQNIGDPL